MKRILIFTGKGGVGKTSVAAAHAVRSAEEGKKTILISTDMAHNLSDLFEVRLGKEEVKVAENLYALEIDPEYTLRTEFSDMMEAMEKMLTSLGEGDTGLDAFSMIPGMEELFSLLKIKELYEHSDYERIIVDCAPTGETLSLLKIPELLCWYMEKFFPLGKVAVRIMSPVSKKLFQVELPNKKAMNQIQVFYARLIELQELLKDKEVCSIRLVTVPEKMIVEETKRNYMYMNLYNYNVDGIFINRVLPKTLENEFFEEWKVIQKTYIDELHAVFGTVPMYEVPWYGTDLMGIEAIRQLAKDAFQGKQDVFSIWIRKEGEHYEQTKDGYELQLYLPSLKKEDVDVSLSGSDVIVKIGNYKRNIPMPNVLRGLAVTGATFKEETLVIGFAK